MAQGVPFRATDEQRRTVRAMAGLGVPHEGIAALLEIDDKTLRKHFHRELARGSVEATAKVAQSLFQMATTGGNVAAAIFWMKARAGWREKHEVELTARTTDVSQLTDQQLEAFINEGYVAWYRNNVDVDGRLIEGATSGKDDDDEDGPDEDGPEQHGGEQGR